jgi:hypothetical protein
MMVALFSESIVVNISCDHPSVETALTNVSMAKLSLSYDRNFMVASVEF